MSSPAEQALESFLPDNALTYFDITYTRRTDEILAITLTEKNDPPTEGGSHSKGFTDITVSDFPARGRKTLLTFRRRYWKSEDGSIIKRDIPITFPGTQLEKEFALFLKEES